jgi:hypothetical protein
MNNNEIKIEVMNDRQLAMIKIYDYIELLEDGYHGTDEYVFKLPLLQAISKMIEDAHETRRDNCLAKK